MIQITNHVSRAFIVLPLLLIGIFTSTDFVYAAGEPVVESAFTQNVLPTSVLTKGEITDEGLSPVIGVWVEYGETNSYGSEIERYNLNEFTFPGIFDVSITGLECDTTYHFRFRVRNNNLLDGYSSDSTFKTSECYFDSMISHWTLNEGDPSLRYDSVGDNDLTSTGSPATLTGYHNDAAGLSTGQYLDITDNASLSTGGETSFTVSLWVKLTAKTGTQVFVSKYEDVSAGEYAIFFEESDDRFKFATYADGTTYVISADHFGSPQVGTWYHIIATHNAVDNTNSIVVDNAKADTLSDVVEHEDSTGPFVVGAFGAAHVYPADAVIDDVRFAKSAYDVPSSFSGTGSGSEIDPYMIVTCSQLQEMENNLSSSYELANNIDCSMTNPDDGDFDGGGTWSDEKGFRPVGDDQTPFTGNFDGNEYSITGLFIDRADDSLGEGVDDESYVGIFGYTSGSGILDLDVFDSKVKGYMYVGGIVGYALNSDIQNVSFNTTTEDNTCDPGNCVWARFGSYGGGIVGYMDQGTISNVSTGGPVKGSGIIIGGIAGLIDKVILDGATSTSNIDGGENLGGIAGAATDSSINDAHASGNVLVVEEQNYGKQGSTGGGLVGYAEGSDFSNSDATGTVTGLNNIGGFAGYLLGGTTSDSFATGDVVGSSSFAGGFVGVSGCGATLSRVYATGAVTGNDYVGGFSGMDGCEGPGATFNGAFSSGDVSGHDYVGGFFGQSYSSTLNDAYSISDVTGNNYVAGFAGYVASSIFNNIYSSGTITATGDSYMGGLIGENVSDQAEITDSFWDGDKTDLTLSCGNGGTCTGVTVSTTTLMNTESTFTDAGWDFEDIWAMDSGNNHYPYFNWQESEAITVELGAVTNIQKDTATLGMTIDAISIKGYGFVLGTSSNPDYILRDLSEESSNELLLNYPIVFADDTQLDSFPVALEHTFSELTCGTRYYYRTFAYNDSGTSIALTPESSFTTLACNDTVPVAPRKKSSGYMRSPAQRKVTFENMNVASTSAGNDASTASDTCPADQLITENLKAPSRNGFYNSYTGKKVSQANRLQAHLNRLGFNAGPVDGIIGPLSTDAIKRMQTFLGTPPDGFVGPLTRAFINNSCGNKANS